VTLIDSSFVDELWKIYSKKLGNHNRANDTVQLT